jgi:SAM-dependent methyltransferase
MMDSPSGPAGPAPRARDFAACEALLRGTFAEIGHLHATPAARHFIAAHWNRYVHILRKLPELEAGAPVLEVGASIISSVLKRRLGADVHTAYHELEGEWADRFAAEGIQGTPLELLRDPLPYPAGRFALILFDEVLEHFPLAPDFFVRQLIRLLRPGGQLILSAPNFATWEHRAALWRGRNPQDAMDERFVYYAHHREPVMAECRDLAARCGGRVVESFWTDYGPPASKARTAWNLLRYLRHLEFHKIAHVLVPSMRSYLFLRIERDMRAPDGPLPPPPMADSREFRPRA